MTAPAMPASAALRLGALLARERDGLGTRAHGVRRWGAAATALAVLAGGVVLLGDGRWLTLWRWLPFVWLGLAAVAAGVAWRTLARRVPAPVDDAVAQAIEHERRLRTGELRIALESEAFGALGARAATLTLDRLAATDGVPLAPRLAASLATARTRAQRGALGAALALVLAAVGWRDGADALARPIAAAQGGLLPALAVRAPGSALRGARPTVTIVADDRARITLALRADGAATPTTVTADVRDGIATVVLPPLAASLTLVATDGRAVSPPHRLQLAATAFLGDVSAEAVYPAYLGRATETIPLAGVVVVPRGTLLRITAHGSVPLRAVSVRSETGDTVRFAGDGQTMTGRLAAQRSGRWQWHADAATPLAAVPPAFALDVRPDSAPVVDLASLADTLLAERDAVSLEVRAVDDHRLASVTLQVVAGGRVRATRPLLAAPAPTLAAQVPLDLGALGIADAGTVTVQAIAVDASPWRQVGRSRPLVVRRSTVTERRRAARAAADSVAAAASALAAAQKELARTTGEAARGAARQAGDSGTMDFDARERAQALAQQQRDLQRQSQQLQQQAKALADQLRSAGALDSSLAGRLAEAQRLMQQAISPQLMQRLQQLEQGAQRLDAQATRQSLDELARQQQALREQLERNAEMLQRAALEGSMETLRDEARELAQAQRTAADSAARGQGRPDEARALAQRSDRLARDVEQLSKRLREADAQPGARRADAAREAAARAADAMQRAAQDRTQAARAGADAAAAMEQAAQQLGDARREQVDAWKQETTAELDQSVTELMQLGEQERRMAEAAQQRGLSREMAQQQASLQAGAQAAAQRLQEAARKSQHVSPGSQRAVQEALQRLQEATRAAQRGATPSSPPPSAGAPEAAGTPAGGPPSGGGERSTPGAQGQPGTQGQGARDGAAGAEGRPQPSRTGAPESAGGGAGGGSAQAQETAGAMRDAARALERAASSLVRDRERANRAGSASGLPEMLQELQQAARQQQQINGQAGSMSMLPGGESGAQAQSLAQSLARRQRQMAQRLDDVSGADGSGRAEALAQEARRLAEAMERAASDPETARRREEFYQRLLAAGRTLRRDDVDEQQPREAKSGIGAATYLPPAGAARGAPATPVTPPSADALRRLGDEERKAVLDYFDRLNRRPPGGGGAP